MSATTQATTDPAHRVPIRVRGLRKSFRSVQVLTGVDFEVQAGTIFALLGSNGAGKTTVVRILSTLLRADAGTVVVNGFDVAAHAADVRESISLTGQFAAVDDVLTGRTWCSSPGSATWSDPARSPTTSWGGSRSPRLAGARCRPTQVACADGWTSP